MEFSCLISVYKNDNPEYFEIALNSIYNRQTVKPAEIVLVVDGPVGREINEIIDRFESQNKNVLSVLRFEKNYGLGEALRQGLEFARNEIVMRMDSDDIAVSDRFEKQLQFMETHPDVVVCGGQIAEFIDDTKNIVGKRIVPCTNDDIYIYMKTRCAFNHVTVALRRSKVQKAGGYLPWFWNEDYYLWIRLMEARCSFANLPDTLVNVRVGNDMYARRGGIKYFKSEVKLQYYMYSNNLIGGRDFLTNVAKRLIVQVLLPNNVRGWVFRTFARD